MHTILAMKCAQRHLDPGEFDGGGLQRARDH